MLIVDAHLDLSLNAIQFNRDIRQSVYTIRTLEQKVEGKGRGQNTVAFPEMRQGKVALSIATLLARSTGRPVPHLDFLSSAQAHGMAHGQLAYYRALEAEGDVRIIEDLPTLNGHMAEWHKWDGDYLSTQKSSVPHPKEQGWDRTFLGENTPDPNNAPPLGFIISMEGADPILAPGQLQAWWDVGLRLLGPTHYGPGRYAGGTGTELGLTEIGAPLLREMDRLGILLDLTHLSDQAFWESLDQYGGLVLASHNNCRALVPHQRQFSDAQLEAIFARDGVIGVAFDAWMIHTSWTENGHNRGILISHVIDHIDHICQLAGNTRHAAIGTDLDGGFGREQSPEDLDTIADLQRIPDMLSERGYSDDDIAGIMHGNWLRFFAQAWGG